MTRGLEAIVYIGVLGFLLLPSIPLFWSWRSSRQDWLPLSLLTLSLLMLVAALTFKAAILGPDYGRRLYVTAAANILVSLAVAVFLLVKRRNLWGSAAGFLLFMDWFYVWSINSVA